MVWVGTSLLTRGVVFQWASTIKTGRRSLVQDGSSTYTPTTCSRWYDHEWLKADYKPDSSIHLIFKTQKQDNLLTLVKVEISTQDSLFKTHARHFRKCPAKVLFKTQKQDVLLTLVNIEISTQDSLFQRLHIQDNSQNAQLKFCSRKLHPGLWPHWLYILKLPIPKRVTLTLPFTRPHTKNL